MKLVTARKLHSCDACGWPIYHGERYSPVTCKPWDHPDNEGFVNLRFCRFCAEAHHLLFPPENDYCLNQEFVHELLSEWIERMPEDLRPGPLVRTPDGWWDSASWPGSFRGWMDDINEARKAAWAGALAWRVTKEAP